MNKRFTFRLRQTVGGIKSNMPNFKKQNWQGYFVKVVPTVTDYWRHNDMFRLLPFFWDSEIILDLEIRPPDDKRKNDETWRYDWELCDLDGKVLNSNNGNIWLNPKEIKSQWWAYKNRAIVLGHLKPNQQYIVKVYFTKEGYIKGDAIKVASFTVKDRDEYYMQLILLFLAIGFSFILWVFGGR